MKNKKRCRHKHNSRYFYSWFHSLVITLVLTVLSAFFKPDRRQEMKMENREVVDTVMIPVHDYVVVDE